MRTIKYRVWDSKIKQYSTEDYQFLISRTGGLWGAVGDWLGVHFDEDDGFEVEQYTGVDDANGKPIYEGDIIEGLFTADEGLTLDGDRIPYFGQVEWCSQSNCLGWYVESQDGGTFELEQCHAKISLDNITGEVIGNIHENPELLEAD